jgi:hypothetical protein
MHSSFGKIWTCLLLQLIAKSFVVQGQNLCPYDYFACTNGQCITSEKQCDGAMDCADKSDENCCIVVVEQAIPNVHAKVMDRRVSGR